MIPFLVAGHMLIIVYIARNFHGVQISRFMAIRKIQPAK
jgi:hypothetical protein